MTTTVSTHSENRWVDLNTFCERSGVPLRRARYWYQNGRLKIKPKAKRGELVFRSLSVLAYAVEIRFQSAPVLAAAVDVVTSGDTGLM